MIVALASLRAFVVFGVLTAAGPQDSDDPALRAAVEQFFAMQQAENVDGYLALWSKTVDRPKAEQLKYIFGSGDDTFSEIAIVGTFPAGRACSSAGGGDSGSRHTAARAWRLPIHVSLHDLVEPRVCPRGR